MKKETITFDRFLTERVRGYFKETNTSSKGNWKLYLKTITFISLFVFSYLLAVVFKVSTPTHILGWFLMGFAIIGIGTGIMHDAAHKAYSKKKWVNNVLARSLNLVGGEVKLWFVKHNELHHSEPNVIGHDDDIESGGLLRFSKLMPFFPYHKYQRVYFHFFYASLTILWILFLDLKKYFQGKVSNRKIENWKWYDHLEFWLTKIWHVVVFIILPVYLTGWIGLLGYILAMSISGYALSWIFQCAHVVETLPIIAPPYEKTSRFRHQLAETTDFKTNFLVKFFVGGLDHQTTHHLFPDICHIHYDKLSRIVKKAIYEWNLLNDENIIYHEYPSFRSAISGHYSVIKDCSNP